MRTRPSSLSARKPHRRPSLLPGRPRRAAGSRRPVRTGTLRAREAELAPLAAELRGSRRGSSRERALRNSRRCRDGRLRCPSVRLLEVHLYKSTGKRRKVPFQWNGEDAAKSNDPATGPRSTPSLRPCPSARSRASASCRATWATARWLVGTHLDLCRSPTTGTLEPWGRRWIDRLRTYAEVSPSGTGVKLLGTVDRLPAALVNGGEPKGIEATPGGRRHPRRGGGRRPRQARDRALPRRPRTSPSPAGTSTARLTSWRTSPTPSPSSPTRSPAWRPRPAPQARAPEAPPRPPGRPAARAARDRRGRPQAEGVLGDRRQAHLRQGRHPRAGSSFSLVSHLGRGAAARTT